MGRSDLAVVIPCHNEAASIGPVVVEAARHARVFVIDDRSTDGSRAAAEKAGATVIAAAQAGYDGALATGLRHARDAGFRFVVTMDADGEHDPKLVAAFRARLRTKPLVLGVRERRQRLAEHLVALAAYSRFGVSDPLCGMKGYARPVIDAWLESGAALNVNMTPAILWRARGGDFDEIKVTGRARKDRPRFGRALSANLAILRAYARALAAT